MLLPIDIHFVSVIGNGVCFSDQGVDIGMPGGTPVVATGDAWIVYSGPDPETGQNLVIIHFKEPLLVDGQAYDYAWYGNLREIDHTVPNGRAKTAVSAGERLGRSGAAHDVPYLHFRLLKKGPGGGPGEAMPRASLERWLWQEVAPRQLGCVAAK